MYSDEQIFIWDYEKLHSIYNHPSERNLLDASVPLRRLLLDKPKDTRKTLIENLSEKYKIELRFKLVSKNFIDDIPSSFPSPRLSFFNPDPSYAPQLQNKELSLVDFLSYHLSGESGVKHSVENIIKYMANVAGGVHLGSPQNAKAKSLNLISVGFTVDGRPLISELLRIIIKIFLNSLESLYLIIKQNHID